MKVDLQRVGALALATASLLIGACTVMPTGPSVMALPGSSKSAEEYQADVVRCQEYSAAAIAAVCGATAGEANNCVIAGSSYTWISSYQLQYGYDRAYLQCMYARGNRVPVSRYARGPSRPSYSTAPAVGYPPPNTPAPLGLGGPGYPASPVAPPSSYPPPDTAPPANLPPRRS